MDKEGGFLNRPPILDGTNYDYWKVRMLDFIKYVDNKAQNVVVKGWDPPKIVGPDGKATNVLKEEEDQDDKDEKASEGTLKH